MVYLCVNIVVGQVFIYFSCVFDKLIMINLHIRQLIYTISLYIYQLDIYINSLNI